jgi:hypothetical protein
MPARRNTLFTGRFADGYQQQLIPLGIFAQAAAVGK